MTEHKFHAKTDGLYLTINGHRRRVAPYIKVLAMAQEEHDPSWFGILEYSDINSQRQQLIVPRSDLRKAAALADRLDNAGYALPNESVDRAAVMEYLRTATPDRRILIVHRTGWVKDAYVFPDCVVPEKVADHIRFEPAATRFGKYSPTKGTLQDWKAEIARPATHSSRMMFGLSVAFASVLLGLMKHAESGGFHFVGPSTKGKSTVLLASSSAARYSRREALVTWDLTTTGLDELAAEHCDSLLCIDETARLSNDPKVAAAKARDAAFRLASGQGRIRSIHWGKKGNRCTWRILFLSTGETGISEIAAAAGKTRLAGDQVRLIDVPAIANPKLGIYESLPDGISAAGLSEQIEAACEDNYGTAIREFTRRVSADPEGARKKVQRWRSRFREQADIRAGGWERRFGQRFGLAYAAARLAAEFGILPWSRDEVLTAITACYRDARRAVPDFDKLTDEALVRIRKNLKRRRGLCDVRSNSKHDEKVARAAGYIKQDDEGRALYLIRPKTLDSWVSEIVSPTFVIERLQTGGHLLQTTRKIATKQVMIAGLRGKHRYYCIKESFLR